MISIRASVAALPVALLLLLPVAPARAGRTTCLTGSDPAVAGDADQIRALEAQFDAACPCASFDGSGKGKRHPDYLRCVAAAIGAAVGKGDLRKPCKGTVKAFHARSTCGFPASAGKVVCVKKTLASGKVACSIESADACRDRAGKSAAHACEGFSLCIAAADTNQDLLVAGPGDSGECSPPPCAEGAQRCQGNVLQTCSGGIFQDGQTCPMACDATLGCVACVPGTGTCEGDVSHACRDDGSGTTDVLCDPVQGMSCGASGLCEGACSPAGLGRSNVGCDYWPTVTGNPVGTAYHFAVAVADPGSGPADVTIEGGALASPVTFTVGAGGVVLQPLPWVPTLKLCSQPDIASCASPTTTAALAVGGAYHLRSNAPLAVYQFNPLEYTLSATDYSYSNDASLLLPAHTWGMEHYVASWPQTNQAAPGLLSVTASRDATHVTITTRSATMADGGAPAFAPGTPQTVMLDAGDVLELGTTTGDLTGSLVDSDAPVQVIGGHYCATVPDGFAYCDHLEESIPPLAALSNRYVVNAPALPVLPGGKEEVVRIIATEPGTTLTYDPPQAGAPTSIASAGDFVEIARQAASYMVTANHRILVAQLMEGQTAAGDDGDPSLALAVPVDQYRFEYVFQAPTSYPTSYVDVTAPTGATVVLDGTSVGGFQAIGSSGYALARVALGSGPANDGNHRITGTQPMGISVYGYGQYTSYWYPGGLGLASLPEPAACSPGSQRACYTGPPETEGVGTCSAGTETCSADGSGYGPCTGQVTTAPDLCGDGIDSDCDGSADGLAILPDPASIADALSSAVAGMGALGLAPTCGTSTPVCCPGGNPLAGCGPLQLTLDAPPSVTETADPQVFSFSMQVRLKTLVAFPVDQPIVGTCDVSVDSSLTGSPSIGITGELQFGGTAPPYFLPFEVPAFSVDTAGIETGDFAVSGGLGCSFTSPLGDLARQTLIDGLTEQFHREQLAGFCQPPP